MDSNEGKCRVQPKVKALSPHAGIKEDDLEGTFGTPWRLSYELVETLPGKNKRQHGQDAGAEDGQHTSDVGEDG